ncbi:MAG: hypothetical protein ACE37F_22195 [Nannocystaceae bacterium]|nr:hypothetical protein [bacterium]
MLFIYATTEAFDFLENSPNQACENQPAAANDRCVDGDRYPLVAHEGYSVETLLEDLEAEDLNLPVYGIGSLGMEPLAEHPADMLSGLNLTLTDGGVNLDELNTFWTGVEDDCANWSALKGDGTAGSATDTSPFWFNQSTDTCTNARPILCVCESVLDPF